MRVYHSLALVAFVLIYLIQESALGAPINNQQEVDSDGLVPIDENNFFPLRESDKTSEESSDESGEGSGTFLNTTPVTDKEEDNNIIEDTAEDESSADASYVDNEIMPAQTKYDYLNTELGNAIN